MLTELAVRASFLLAQGDGAGGNTGQIPTCVGAPPGAVANVASQILGWVKWGSLAILTIAFFAAVGMMVWGRVTYHPRGARIGFDALVVCLVAAVIYVAGYSIITTVTGC